MVDPPEHTVNVDDPARFRCWVPQVPQAVLTWRPANGDSLPSGAEQRDGFLNIPRAQHHHEGQYICAAYDPADSAGSRKPVDSDPVRLNVNTPVDIITLPPQFETPMVPQVDPPYQTVDLGNPAKFK